MLCFGGKAEPNREEKAHHPLGTHRTALLALAQSLVLLPALCLHIGLNLTQPPVNGDHAHFTDGDTEAQKD